ncbi:ABC multidrug transporter mdr2 [Niveomyces insectorum RCEF 264]|uniref:ABC multidrug transporter mdr2 n=1 Tax=Niveomyces insectorum RCEF 264 TaxID=1081102 RepID=A0A167X6E8_9HYPO|nr:ABC multidrug transporter mdr2 [Niveomyces insectorum RCEF 264]
MAYTDDAVLAKLSALNETHDSIATAAQWIMFHRRHAERTVQLWFQRLKDSPSPKRLNLVYLANEVTQQSKARHKEDFVLAFSPVIAEAIASAYKGAPSEVQTKLRRVVDVWHDRSIFEAPIQAAVESRIDELDKAKGATRSSLGGSIFGSNVGSASVGATASFPQELASLVAPQQSVTKLLIATQGSVSKADTDYNSITSSPPPAAPVHAARLNGLLRTLADGEEALRKMIKARTELKGALDALQAVCAKSLEADVQHLRELEQRKVVVDTKKREVEDRILSGLTAMDAEHTPGEPGAAGSGPMQEPPRPEVEALTPPPNDPDDFPEPVFPGAEAFSAPASNDPPPGGAAPALDAQEAGAFDRDGSLGSSGNDRSKTESAPPLPQPAAPAAPPPSILPATTPSASGIDILSHLASQAIPVSTNGTNKRRRVDIAEDVPDLDDGIDADVAETLRKDSQAA